MTNRSTNDSFGMFEIEGMQIAIDEPELFGCDQNDACEERNSDTPDTAELAKLSLDLTATWTFVLEDQSILEKMLALPVPSNLRKRNPALYELLASRITRLLYGYNQVGADIKSTMGPVEWFRIHLLEVIYHLVKGAPSDITARDNLWEINRRLAAWGFKDRSKLLTVLNAYLGVNPTPGPVDGVVLVEAIGGGADKQRDEPIQNRYAALTHPMPLVDVALASSEIAEILNSEFPWMEPVTMRLCALIRDRQHFSMDGPVLNKPILLVGDPGSGKTYYAQRFAELTRVPFRVLSVGGMNDNMVLKGSARHWNGTRPSAIAEFINEKQCPNPLFILDELDKAGSGKNNGNPYDTLIQLMEPRNAAQFFDECLLTEVDLSRVSYLATANSTETLPDPLKDRMSIWRVPSPEPVHLVELAVRVWWKHWNDMGVPSFMAPGPDVDLLERAVAKAPSIRQVKSIVSAVLRCTSSDKNLLLRH